MWGVCVCLCSDCVTDSIALSLSFSSSLSLLPFRSLGCCFLACKELRTIYHHHREQKKKSSEGNSGHIDMQMLKTDNTVSTIAIFWSFQGCFQEEGRYGGGKCFLFREFPNLVVCGFYAEALFCVFFAPFCALLRICTLLRTCVCALLRSFEGFCLERPRLGTADYSPILHPV